MKRHEVQPVGKKVRIFLRDGSRNWHACWCQDGKERVRSLKTAVHKEALKAALKLDERLAEGTLALEGATGLDQGLVDRYLGFLESENRSPRTLKRYRPELERFVKFCNEQQRVREIRSLAQRHLDAYRAQRKTDGCAESTRYHESILVVQFGNYLVRSGWVEKNPFAGHGIVKPRPAPQACFSVAQVEAILVACKEPTRSIYEVLAFTGMRVGEAKHLTWDDVYWDRNLLHVRPKEGWETKNHKDRLIPMHDRVRSLLERLPRRHRWILTAGKSGKFPNGGGQISERHLLEKLKRILDRLGIEGCVHSFRHFFASHCADRGVPPMQLLTWLGHSSLKMLQRYYHQDELESRQAMAKLVGSGEPGVAQPEQLKQG